MSNLNLRKLSDLAEQKSPVVISDALYSSLAEEILEQVKYPQQVRDITNTKGTVTVEAPDYAYEFAYELHLVGVEEDMAEDFEEVVSQVEELAGDFIATDEDGNEVATDFDIDKMVDVLDSYLR